MVCVLLLLPKAFLALGWLLELRPHDTILRDETESGMEDGRLSLHVGLLMSVEWADTHAELPF